MGNDLAKLSNFIEVDSTGKVNVNDIALSEGVMRLLLNGGERVVELRGMSEDIRDEVLKALTKRLSVMYTYEKISAFDFERRRYEFGINIRRAP